tara:strand:- start:1287 stop:1766 length:480 start_codon:yes stop_codon:yes gene_type:complete
MKIFKKKFILLIATLLIANCGFKVLDKSQLQNLKIESLETKGDKKTSFLIKSNLQKYFTNNENGERIFLIIKTNKTKSIKEKNLKNQIKKYEISLSANISIKYLDKLKDKNFTIFVNGSFDVSDNHSTTISNQNNLEKNLAKKSTDLIIKEIILKINDN